MTTAIAAPTIRRRRLVAFRIVCVLVALLLLPSAVSVLAPWIDVNLVGLSHPERARWSLAVEGSVDLLVIGCLVIVAVRVRQARLLVQLIAAIALLAAIVVTPFTGPSFLITVALLAAVVGTYPVPAELLARPRSADLVRPLLAVTVPAAGVLITVALASLRDQMALPRGHQPDLNLLVTDAEHLLILALAGIAAGLGGPGWRALAMMVGAVWAYVGVTSIMLPDQPESWGPAAGAAAVAVGIAIVAVTVRTPLSTPRPSPRAR